MNDPYIRKAKVLRIVDGDTIHVNIDLGLSITIETALRLAGINAPEVVGATKADGLAATAWLASKIPVGSDITVKTEKPKDKYGRYLAWVYAPGFEDSVNIEMFRAGFAVLM
jgi:micrococcal nuclease